MCVPSCWCPVVGDERRPSLATAARNEAGVSGAVADRGQASPRATPNGDGLRMKPRRRAKVPGVRRCGPCAALDDLLDFRPAGPHPRARVLDTPPAVTYVRVG